MEDLRKITQAVFTKVLLEIDAGDAVCKAVRIVDNTLQINGEAIDLTKISAVYSIARGKAALPMAQSLNQILGEKLVGGIISAHRFEHHLLPKKWKIFHGGHPIPNKESLAAAESAIKLLKKIDDEDALVIFLIRAAARQCLKFP